ncbi:MFS transporter [Candidatus Pacearchaeota archaeon]|jgi:DHA1 family quinolone resistance protein-like MFS transporter|nr:MFS transporter [Candidatus Pacearchaeota archaeon]
MNHKSILKKKGKNFFKNLKMNKTLGILIISDIFILGGFGLITPILAIFIEGGLADGSVSAAGFASMIWFFTYSILQIVFSYKFNPKDRLWMLKLGTIIIAIVPFAYMWITSVIHLYIIEFAYGVGAALAYPAWSSLFTAHLEKGARGFQYALHSSGVGFAAAITAGVGGWIAEHLSLNFGIINLTGFHLVFLLTGIISVTGLLFLFYIEKKALRKT